MTVASEALDVIGNRRRWSVERADCLDFLRALPDDSVDLIFTSPPYELARLYYEDGADLGIARDTEAWVAWLVEVVGECVRVCRGLTALVVEGQTRNYRYSCGPMLLMADLCRAGFNLRKPPVYHRVGIPGSGGPDWLRNDWEPVVCVTRPGRLPWSDNTALGEAPKYGPGGAMSYRGADGTRKSATRRTGSFEYKTGRRGPGGERQAGVYVPPAKANPGNVLYIPVGGGLIGNELAHANEAPFPERLAEFFVRSFCPPDGLACDIFSGSGTTLSESVRWGRRFVGCDLRQSQVDLSRRRIATVTPMLFAAAPGDGPGDGPGEPPPPAGQPPAAGG